MRNPFIFVHYIDIHHSGRFPEGVHRYAFQIREGDEYHHEASPGWRVRHYSYWQQSPKSRTAQAGDNSSTEHVKTHGGLQADEN